MNINLDGYEIETDWHLEEANNVFSLNKMFQVLRIAKNGILEAVSNDYVVTYDEIYKEPTSLDDYSDLKDLVGQTPSFSYNYVLVNINDVRQEELCLITCQTGGAMMETNVRFACYRQHGHYKLLSYFEDGDFIPEFEDRFRIVAKTSYKTEKTDLLIVTNLLLAAFEIYCWDMNGLAEELPVIIAESGELINSGPMDTELYTVIKRNFQTIL